MQFVRHPELKDRHSDLSPSKSSWIRYDDEQLVRAFENRMNAALGTRLHALADELILLGVKLPDNTKTLNMYVNDCIALGMKTEVPLYVSEEAFGTADAINYEEDVKLLRIFDLKNGETKVSDEQLEVYAAYFCIEYKKNPLDIGYDLRYYQNDEVYELTVDPEDILYIMDQARHAISVLKRQKGVL